MTHSIAVICNVYNEKYFLPLWYDYYAKQLGKKHLYIIDDGSTDGSTDFITQNKIRLPRTAFDDITRVEMIAHFQAALLTHYDAVLYTDCDEIIVPRPSKYASLAEYITRHPDQDLFRCVGIDIMQKSKEDPRLDFTHPILSQRPYGFFSPYSCKPVGGRITPSWEPGFHNSNQNNAPDKDLWLFHLKWADTIHTMDRLAVTRAIEWSERAIAQRLGFSHRIPDSTMKLYIEKKQASRSEESLDDLDFVKLLETRQDSNVRRIPDEFLHAF